MASKLGESHHPQHLIHSSPPSPLLPPLSSSVNPVRIYPSILIPAQAPCLLGSCFSAFHPIQPAPYFLSIRNVSFHSASQSTSPLLFLLLTLAFYAINTATTFFNTSLLLLCVSIPVLTTPIALELVPLCLPREPLFYVSPSLSLPFANLLTPTFFFRIRSVPPKSNLICAASSPLTSFSAANLLSR